MTMLGKILKKSATAVAIAGLTVSTAMASTTLRLAHNLNQDHSVHKAFVYMNEQLRDISGGKMRLRIYPSSQMGDAPETLQMLQTGALDMSKGSASDLEAFEKTYSVFNLPYLFNDDNHFRGVVYGDIGQEIMKTSKDKGFFSISAYEAGYRSFYASKPIRTPDDLRGMKVRVQATPTTLEMVRLLGGSPTPIPFGETYTALQQGVVDAAENNEPSYVDTRHVETSKYFSEGQHTSIPDFLVISTRAWNRLNEQEREWLMEAAARSEKYQSQMWSEAVATSRAAAKELGAEFISVDKTPFQEAVAPLYDDFRKDPEQAAILDKILEVSNS